MVKSKNEQSKTVQRIALDGVGMALYLALSFLTISIGNLKFTVVSLIVLLVACLFGPLDAVIVAIGGEFLNQVLRYGVTVTTPLWVLPPALRGLIVALAAWLVIRYLKKPIERVPALFFPVCVVAALLTTCLNTFVIFVDAVVFDYYTPAYVWAQFGVRILTGVITAVLMCLILTFVLPPLRREGIGRAVLKPDGTEEKPEKEEEQDW